MANPRFIHQFQCGAMRGMALLSCVQILFAASILMMSSGLMLTESALLSSHTQEKNIALQAAQSALADARVVISKGLVDVISTKNILYGSLTGNRLQLGGRLQPKQLPWYRIQQFELPHIKNTTAEEASAPQSSPRLLYRVTILAYGAQSTTQVILESDFSKVGCEQDHACENFSLRRLNWRLLDQLPADW
jgi:Tfp pilus assembly protein PilX